MSLEAVVDSATYKPGWELSLRTMHDWPHLWVHAEVQDSEPPHGLTRIDHIIEVPPSVHGYPEDRQRAWVRDAVLSIERHEVGEWLRFGQDRPFYPDHNEGDPYA